MNHPKIGWLLPKNSHKGVYTFPSHPFPSSKFVSVLIYLTIKNPNSNKSANAYFT